VIIGSEYKETVCLRCSAAVSALAATMRERSVICLDDFCTRPTKDDYPKLILLKISSWTFDQIDLASKPFPSFDKRNSSLLRHYV